jgi:Rrf2 family protein
MLSRTAQYAMRALVYLSRQSEDNYHQTQVIAEQLRIPSNYLGKILQKMARQHIVESQKGLLGGFRMAKAADQINLYEIMASIDSLPSEGAPRTRQSDPVELINLEQRFATINSLYVKFLKETTLAAVMSADQQACGNVFGKAVEPEVAASAI